MGLFNSGVLGRSMPLVTVKNVGTVGSMTLISRVTGLVRDIAFAQFLGSGALAGDLRLGGVLARLLPLEDLVEPRSVPEEVDQATLAFSACALPGIDDVDMLLAGLLINSTPHLLNLIYPDCHGVGWAVPREAWFAISYWVLLGSVASYYLLTWGNLYVDASMVGAYFTVQPMGAVAAALAVILATPGTDHYGLKGPGIEDVGVVGIFIGVWLLIVDARRQPTTRTATPGGGAGEDGSDERYVPLINGEAHQPQVAAR